MNNQITMPTNKLELLRKEKEKLKQLCAEKEDILNKDFRYLSENASDIIVDTLYNTMQTKLSLLFSSKTKSQKGNENTTSAQKEENATDHNITALAYEFIKQNFTLGTAFKIARPIITTFIIRRIKRFIKR